MTPTAHFPDISHFEPDVQFHDIAAGGCPLVITKCTEGSGYTDPTYQDFAARVRSVPGLIFFAYVFEDAAPEGSQIAHFFSTAHLHPGDGMPILDAEAAGLTRTETEDALEDMQRRGYSDPILYCDLSYYRDVLGSPTRWLLWLADYTGELPALPDGVRLFGWQHTDRGDCPGVAKPCDMSYLYVPVTELPNSCIQ